MSWPYGFTASRIEAAATAINAAVVILLAYLNYRYLKSANIMAKAAQEQSEASREQALAATKTLNILLADKKETDSYQRTVFQTECRELCNELIRLENMVVSQAKPYGLARNPRLNSDQWDIVRQFVTRNAPTQLSAMLAFEMNLPNDQGEVLGVIMAPDSMWVATFQRRVGVSRRLKGRRQELEEFAATVLKIADERMAR